MFCAGNREVSATENRAPKLQQHSKRRKSNVLAGGRVAALFSSLLQSNPFLFSQNKQIITNKQQPQPDSGKTPVENKTSRSQRRSDKDGGERRHDYVFRYFRKPRARFGCWKKGRTKPGIGWQNP